MKGGLHSAGLAQLLEDFLELIEGGLVQKRPASGAHEVAVLDGASWHEGRGAVTPQRGARRSQLLFR